MIVNKYRVEMYECGKDSISRASSTIAASEEEAIEKLRHDKFWYNEGTGHDYRKIEFPVTFKAKIIND